MVVKKCELATNSVIDVAANQHSICSVKSFQDDLRAFAIQVFIIIIIIIRIMIVITVQFLFLFLYSNRRR